MSTEEHARCLHLPASGDDYEFERLADVVKPAVDHARFRVLSAIRQDDIQANLEPNDFIDALDEGMDGVLTITKLVDTAIMAQATPVDRYAALVGVLYRLLEERAQVEFNLLPRSQ
jgi:hypothetical protein